MRGLILALVLTVVEPDFSENKVYLFNYESILVSGLPEKGLARAGIRIKSKVEISGIGPKLCLIRIHSIEAAEYNGVWPTSSFSRSLKLTQVLTGELRIPIKFEYSNGRVGNLMAPDSVSDDALNIYRGILNVLELSLKKMQHSYSLQEAGIGGICNTTYTIQENKRANLVYVTKSKDLNSCEEKVQLVTGSAYTQPCRTCQQATATYNYKIKYTRNEVVITQADVEEIHQFAPFNEITGGNAIVEARQKLALTDVQKQMAEVPPKEFQDRGSLQYQFGSELLQLPVHLFKIKNVESQIEESLQDLVETTSEQLPRDAPAKALKLMHLFRAANEDNYESVWKQFSSRPVYRRYILDIIPAVASHRALRFLRHKMERQELTNWEAAQTVLVALHSSTPTQDTMEEATLIVKKHCPRSSTVLGKVCYLSYASLCHKQCSSSDSCSECLQLLHGFAGEALSKSNTEEISLALKALGNVGHPASIKHIKKFLPGYATGASDLPLKVHATAVMALKNIGMKDPKMVQAITLEIFLNQKLHPRVRMLAAVVLLETKPGLPILMTLADAVLKEPSMQVASFIYSHLRALGRSTLKNLASACRMAIRALSAKFDRSGYQFSKVFCFKILMSGLAAKYLVLNNVGSLIPTMAMSQLRTHFLGRIADPLEVGITVEGLQEIFAKGYSPDRDWETDYDFKEILKTLSDWKAFSSDKPFASGYLKMFGQELFFEKIPSIRKIISSLQSGVGRQWTKALLSSEIRRIVPTCTGFPTETSFYYSSITKVAGNVQAQITPSPKSDFRLTELLNANIRLRSKMSLSMAKEMTFVMGINTHMIQAGLEAHTKINAHVPVNVVATVQMKEKNIKIEIPPCKDETNIITLRKAGSSSSSASSTSGSAESTTSSPSSSDSDNRASQGGTQINLKTRQSKAKEKKFYPFGDSGGSSSISSSGSSSGISSSKSSSSSSKSSSNSGSSSSKSSSSSSSSKNSSSNSSSSSKSSSSSSKSSSSSSSSKSSSSNSSKGSSSSKSQSSSSKGRSSSRSSSSSSSSTGSSSSSKAPGIKQKAKKRSKTTPFPLVSAPEGERSVREQKRKTQSSSSSSRSTSSGISSSSKSTGASHRHSKYDRQAEMKRVKSQFNSHSNEARLRWGKECQDYKIAATATTGKLARKPAVQLKVQWGNLPSWIKKTSTAFMKYVPGAALVLGFSEAHQRNPSREVIVRVAATSPRTIDTVIKAPGVQVAFNTLQQHVHHCHLQCLFWFCFAATCEVREGDFKTFDHMSHTYSFNKSCSLIVAQDYHLMIHCLPTDNVKISKNETTVIVEAPTHGLKKVTFDGVILKITVASWMRGRTCGICGNNDREKHNELLMPNHKLAHSCSAFVHSWVLLEESCSGGCKLQRSYVKLNRNPTVDGEESMCYSVDPVLKCMKDCTPIKKTSVKVGFHCFPKGTIFFFLCVSCTVGALSEHSKEQNTAQPRTDLYCFGSSLSCCF
uniref:Uncharacterized protein n=1 Tax=Strigops habroptila TaxID=2489341 RepID=A0A672ULS7_STRHB